MKIVFYDGKMENILGITQDWIAKKIYDKKLDNLSVNNVDAGWGPTTVLREFDKLCRYEGYYPEVEYVVITNSLDILKKVSYKNIYLFDIKYLDTYMNNIDWHNRDHYYSIFKVQDCCGSRELRESHNIRNLYLSGDIHI